VLLFPELKDGGIFNMSVKDRYKNLLNKQKQRVTAEDAVTIKEDAESAKKLLENPEFQFFRTYLREVQKSITDIIVQNRIKTVRETVTDDVGVSREYETTREEQILELSGKYKLVDEIFDHLNKVLVLPKELDMAKEKGTVEIVDNEEG
jgi:dTDP-D-glucose 4,6-dehydratase